MGSSIYMRKCVCSCSINRKCEPELWWKSRRLNPDQLFDLCAAPPRRSASVRAHESRDCDFQPGVWTQAAAACQEGDSDNSCVLHLYSVCSSLAKSIKRNKWEKTNSASNRRRSGSALASSRAAVEEEMFHRLAALTWWAVTSPEATVSFTVDQLPAESRGGLLVCTGWQEAARGPALQQVAVQVRVPSDLLAATQHSFLYLAGSHIYIRDKLFSANWHLMFT